MWAATLKPLCLGAPMRLGALKSRLGSSLGPTVDGEAVGMRPGTLWCRNSLVILMATRAGAQRTFPAAVPPVGKRAGVLNFYLKVSFLKWNVMDTHLNESVSPQDSIPDPWRELER